MTNTHGENRVIVDTDGLIGLIKEDDALHERSVALYTFLQENNFEIIVPYPIVLEVSTAIARFSRHSRPDLAQRLLRDFSGPDTIEELNIEIKQTVGLSYDPNLSKKHTPFDHYVLALALQNGINYIFSFDQFYKKHGLILLEDILS